MSVSGIPFDDIRELIAGLPEGDERAAAHAVERNHDLVDRFGFSKHEAELNTWLATWSGKSPIVSRPMIALFAGTHKTADGLEDALGETTLARVTLLAAGGAPVNQVCASHDIGLKVFDLALQFPVGDITVDAALDEKGSAATIGFGMEAIAGGVDILGLAAFGQGEEAANAAILGLLFDQPPESFLSHLPQGVADKVGPVAAAAMALHHLAARDPLELLRCLGGREHSALLGAILAARVNHIPVVLDGTSAIVVANLLIRLAPQCLEHCVFAGSSLADTTVEAKGLERAQKFAGLQSVLGPMGFRGDGRIAGHAIAVLKSIATTHANTVLEEDVDQSG